MKFVEVYRGYQIYVEPAPTRIRDSPYYIAIHPKTHHNIDGVDLPDVKSDVDEALR